MPSNYRDYPANWRDLRAAVQRRAGDRCEHCGVANHAYVQRRRFGIVDLGPVAAEILVLGGERVTRIVCTTAHRPGTSKQSQDLGDLLFLCQACHLRLDADAHARAAAATRRRRREDAEQLPLAAPPADAAGPS